MLLKKTHNYIKNYDYVINTKLKFNFKNMQKKNCIIVRKHHHSPSHYPNMYLYKYKKENTYTIYEQVGQPYQLKMLKCNAFIKFSIIYVTDGY